jgi:site-specific recombinase XerD
LNRDIYNRPKKLEHWKNKAKNELDSFDLIDVFKLIEHMEDTESSTLWIVRCITALLLLRKQLDKPFKDAKKEDIKKLLKWMDEDKNYKASTIEKMRTILKSFYKIVYGNNEEYPESVKWFSVNVGKEKLRKEKRIDIEEYLEEEELKKLVENAESLQKKAFLGCMYESGARPEEFLTLSNKDILIDTKGAIFILRGKTGERRVRIIAYVSLLQEWLDIHPLNTQNEFPLWISEATNYKNQQLGLRGAEKIIEKTMEKANILNKKPRLYVLRHSRATHLSKYLSEAQMCTMFGWRLGTKVVRNYIHLSGKDVDNVLISLNENGKVVQDEYKIKPLKCTRCQENIDPSSNFCGKCALPISTVEQYCNEVNLIEENKMLQNKLNSFEEKINEQIGEIMELIRQNPLLAQIKPSALARNRFKYK